MVNPMMLAIKAIEIFVVKQTTHKRMAKHSFTTKTDQVRSHRAIYSDSPAIHHMIHM